MHRWCQGPEPPTPLPASSFFSFLVWFFLLYAPTPFLPHIEAWWLMWTAGVAQGGLWPSGAVSGWCTGALHRGLSLKELPIKLICSQQSTDLYLFSSLISIQNRPFRRLATADCAAVCLFGCLRRNLLSTGQALPLLVSKAYNCHCQPCRTKRLNLHWCEVSWRLWMQVQPCVLWSALSLPLKVEKRQEIRSSIGLVPSGSLSHPQSTHIVDKALCTNYLVVLHWEVQSIKDVWVMQKRHPTVHSGTCYCSWRSTFLNNLVSAWSSTPAWNFWASK